MSIETNISFNNLRKILERNGPFCHSDFECGEAAFATLSQCKVLIVGSGGLGCELVKDLALMGFTNLHLIDMDVIELSNLNRQFLFRQKDIGKSKAEVAAKFINERIPGVKVTPYFNKIQDFGEDFYRSFHVIVCGLDSIVARRWMNGMVISLLEYEDSILDQSSIKPLIDGGTEGFKGSARVILPGITPCIECTLDLFPPQVNFPLCTIANTPRLPEHCIEYVRILQWPKEKPFGDIPLDGDEHTHVQWVYEKALERAQQYGIEGVTYRLTQGVIKHIIPAVASTNAVIAAACATEVFKLATSCCAPMNNSMMFNDVDGIYSHTYEAERNENCPACSNTPQDLFCSIDDKLETIINYLKESPKYQMHSPGITTAVDGKNKTLYIQSVASIEEKTRPNLKKTLRELGLENGQMLFVADVTSPNSFIFVLKIGNNLG
ncbi:NEDD8-activating enzyme E1 catalytic subunit-like isoform X2 [Dinothrombium tinctorium]|uniref:NEDD8-activating enzyme E1 catalytic subunit n=1 Tax=Dinothrombium tinctorium TaxID=1965070 RepID=A0A443RAK4_9ACAR|nr:NEDD8-activating enzyme E1 catalytic subunit-like isoform X2 [Dinothrombium tinctorium]